VSGLWEGRSVGVGLGLTPMRTRAVRPALPNNALGGSAGPFLDSNTQAADSGIKSALPGLAKEESSHASKEKEMA
jgi:hypothetical protein